MVDTPKTKEDFENMTDEDFLKLNEQDFSGDMAEGETDFTEHKAQQENTNAEEAQAESESDDGNSAHPSDPESDESKSDPNSSASTEEEKEEETSAGADPHAGAETDPGKEAAQIDQQSGEDPEKEGKTPEQATTGSGSDVDQKAGDDTPAKAGFYKMPEGATTDQMDQAVEFYRQISVPFKADGKEIQVRSPEEAIRLMQMGLNYNRRMQELKPIKQMNRMLEDQNIKHEDLNFMIDLVRGNKEAIKKLIKDHNIDVMDLDLEESKGYQATNYAGDTQSNIFRDAIETVMDTPTGQDLIHHIYHSWDDVSKGRLRENPSILGNLNAMKASGVYDRVHDEVEHQRAMGYLTDVPYLQAFDEVGEVMKNMGLFDNTQSNGTSMAPLKGQPQKTPIAEGARKDPVPKKADPNPHLSSTPPSRQKVSDPKQPDFDKMSDEDFMKLAPPS